ncbi:MAG: zinc-dependent metalloprotease family protein [Cocleimonas sp.]
MEIKTSIAPALGVFMGLVFIIGFNAMAFAGTPLWQDVKSSKTLAAKGSALMPETTGSAYSAYQKARLLHLDISLMKNTLSGEKPVLAKRSSPMLAKNSASRPFPLEQLEREVRKIDLPLPDGSMIRVSVVEDNILPKALSDKFPQITLYKVQADEFIASGKVDVTSQGFHALLLTREGESILIDPVSHSTYVSYKKSDQKSDEKTFSCGANVDEFKTSSTIEFNEESPAQNPLGKQLQSKASAYKARNSLLTYRIAIAATGEYTAKHGGTVAGALSAISTTINRVNQVFEQDLGIRLVLVENNDKLIYTRASSDPYSGNDSKGLVYQNQSNIDAVIGRESYDIGHLFTTSGGGLAAIASACNDYRKAQGISGISNPRNDSFNLDFVAHEIGHQFGATHTFNGQQGLCSGSTRAARTAFEPGSGSTVMSYAGYCGQDNLQTNTDAMFHIGSIRQIRSYMMLKQNEACGRYDNHANTPPEVEAGKNYVIPAQTPFELVGEASDPDGDALIMAWQQVDYGRVSPVNVDAANNALFRVHPLSNDNSRVFPPIKNILNHTSVRGENLPIQQRQMRFRFVVQDSHNITQSDAMTVQVQRTGSRFALHLPRSQYSLGGTHKVLWNVANTDVAPVNCQSVDISLSLDGGYHFAQIIGENIQNTGEAWVTIPATLPATSRGRFKVACSDNVFFAVSYRNFLVNDMHHVNRLVLSDEDQPENDLEDFDISKINYSRYNELTSAEAGGAGMFWIFMLFTVVVIRKGKTAI